MSVFAVAAPTTVARQASGQRGAAGRSRAGVPALLRALPAARPPAVDDPQPAPPESEPLTVTVSIGATDAGRRDRVLAALQQLITAAGSDIAVTGSGGDVPGGGSPVTGSPVTDSPVTDSAVTGSAGRAGVTAPAARKWWAGAPVPGLRLNPGPRTVVLDGAPVELSRLEYDLLLFLARHPGQVFSRNQLLTQVWGHIHTGARTVDVHVSRLRTKLGADTEVIATVYGLGYRLADAARVTVVDPLTGR